MTHEAFLLTKLLSLCHLILAFASMWELLSLPGTSISSRYLPSLLLSDSHGAPVVTDELFCLTSRKILLSLSELVVPFLREMIVSWLTVEVLVRIDSWVGVPLIVTIVSSVYYLLASVARSLLQMTLFVYFGLLEVRILLWRSHLPPSFGYVTNDLHHIPVSMLPTVDRLLLIEKALVWRPILRG